MMRRRRVGLVCVLCGLVASCSPPPDEIAIRQELLSADPAFTAVLQKRDEQAARIKLLARELSLKQSHVNRQIKNLRAELTEARSQVKQKREAIKRLLQPDQKRVAVALETAVESHRAKRSQQTHLKRSLSRLQRELKQGDSDITDAQRHLREAEVTDLTQAIQHVGHEVSGLSEHIRLLKIKRRLLRL